MAGGVTLQVRQIGSYPLATSAAEGGLVLIQEGGLGTPYASMTMATLVSTALANSSGPLIVGIGDAPQGASSAGVYAGEFGLPVGSGLVWGSPANESFTYQSTGYQWSVGGTQSMRLSNAGALSLPYGTLTVARDPGSALEVATMGWVGNNTVASFNGRKGVVQLTSADVYAALCLDSAIATQNWVNGQIQTSIQLLLANHPFVFGWNGRTGAVYLTLADISCVFFQPGQQPITQTPPLTSNDYSIPNTAWVVEYIANEFAGGGTTLATQQWVLANTVNSFNGRQGVVTLTSSDVFDVGAAPLNSPAFSGIPTAPTAAVGQATGQIATTAFVQQAITNNTAGVSTFNTRTGDVVLEAADVIGVGGLVNPSAGLTGNPTCPTQPPGTNLPVIANCEFVQAAIAAGTVTSFNTRTGAVTLTLADITGVGGAPLVSPAFSSVPTAPTAAPGTATVQLATCAFVANALATAGGVSSFNSRTGAVDLIANDISAAGGLVNPSVGLTGSPTATTATAGDNSTRIATTAFVQTALSSGAVSSFNSRTGAVTLQGADITAAGGALLASPAFTGAPTAPTAAPATNNTQIATTAYVTAAILADTTGVTSFNTRTGAVVLTTADITGAGGAPLASPSFTGVPLGPTATAGTSTTQLATTAFVQAAIASSGVSSFNSRTGAVTLIANDISAAGGALLASPTFTGTPAAPTAAPGTNTTQLATTAFVTAALSTGLAGYLPLSGGTVTGEVLFNRTASGGPQIVAADTGGNGLIQLGSGASLSALAGNMTIASPTGTNLAQLTVDATVLAASGTVTAATQFNVGNAGNFVLVDNGTARYTFYNGPTAGGHYDFWQSGTGNRQWVGASNSVIMTLAQPSGNLTISGTLTQGSDATNKTNITPIAQGISLVRRLIPKSFAWNSTPDQTQWGFIAQDVQPVVPAAVGEGLNDLLALDVTALVAVLVNAVKQLDERCKALEAGAGITPPAQALA